MNGLGRKNAESVKSKDNNSIFTKETWGVILLLFTTILFVCLVTSDLVFSLPGKYVREFLLGSFGYFAYVVTAGLFVVSIELIVGKTLPFSFKSKFLTALCLILVATIGQMIFMKGRADSYKEYLNVSFTIVSDENYVCSFSGLVVSLLAYPVQSLLTVIGGSVVLGIILLISAFALVRSFKGVSREKTEDKKFRNTYIDISNVKNGETIAPQAVSGEKEYPVSDVYGDKGKPNPTQSLFIHNEKDFHTLSKKDIERENSAEIKYEFTEKGLGVADALGSYTDSYEEEMKKKIEYIKTPVKLSVNKDKVDNTYYQATTVSDPIPKKTETGADKIKSVLEPPKYEETKSDDIPLFEHTIEQQETTIKDDSAEKNAEDFISKYAYAEETDGLNPEPDETFRPIPKTQTEPEERVETVETEKEQPQNGFTEPFAEPTPTNVLDFNEPDISETEETKDETAETEETFEAEEPVYPYQSEETASKTETSFVEDLKPIEEVKPVEELKPTIFKEIKEIKSEPVEEEKKEKVQPPINRKYVKPPLDLLESYETNYDNDTENHQERMDIIKQTLEDFHINAEPQSYIQGPAITRYEIMMPAGVSVRKVLSYDDDLKMRLASVDGVRIEAPIPGKNLVGIEVANKKRVKVGLKELLIKSAEKTTKPESLFFAIGKDIVGNAITDNLAKGPHFLVAGATGSGKSVCLNVMIISLIMKYSPEELRLILVDPKSVGFRIYQHLPHLMIDEIITEPKRALTALAWAQEEMERRYKVFNDCPELITDIEGYNTKIAGPTVAKMPRIVVVIDELADLMESCKKDMETRIRMIAQKARAAGIHLVLATQRPSVDIITGTIKANLPSRIALKVMNFPDSNTILSQGGAEKLLGNGDMLYKNSSMADVARYQGAFLSDEEISRVVNYIIENNQAYFDDELSEYLDKATRAQTESAEQLEMEGVDSQNEINDFFLKALWLAVNSKTVSVSMFQRKFQIGYSRAGGLIDKMEKMGFISGSEGSKPRSVLLTKEEYIERFGNGPEIV